jgi:carbon monoxide dehydrogenase subunit G
MKLEYNGQEQVPLTKSAVWDFINDPQKVASCLPDVQEVTVHDDKNFDAVVAIGLGPVRGKFKFKIMLDPQADGSRMNVKISGGGFGSAVDLLAGADLKDNGDSTTTLDWSGAATMRGPIATVGGRVLDAQAQKLISTTFANVKTRMAGG